MKKKLLFSIFIMLLSLTGFAQAEAYQPADLYQCDSNAFNLAVQTPVIIGNQSPNEVQVTYFTSAMDADMGNNPIPNPSSFVSLAGSTVIYARVSDFTDNTYAITQFVIVLAQTPALPPLESVSVCENYTLPALTVPNANYYADPACTIALAPGTLIDTTSVIYVKVTNGTCSSQGSFVVYVLQSPPQFGDISECQSFYIGQLPLGNFYTGPNATGTIIPAGTVINTTTTLYAHIDNGVCSTDEMFTITITGGPVITSQPAPLIKICPGEQATLSVNAVGDNLFYQWYKDNVGLVSGDGPSITVGESGIYRCFVSDNSCMSQTTPVELIVGVAPPTVFPEGGVVCQGNPFNMYVTAEGDNLSFQWYFNEIEIVGATTPFYGKPNAVNSDSGYYKCKVTGTSCGVPVYSGAYLFAGGPTYYFDPMESCLENGVGVFDLTTINVQGENPNPAQFSIYASMQDAENQVNPIPETAFSAYTTSQPNSAVWIRINNGPAPCPISISPVELIAIECTANTITGTIRLDSDNNGCTANDGPASGIQVVSIHNNDFAYAYTNNNGEYTFTNVAEGYHYISTQYLPAQFNVPTPDGYELTVTGTNTTTPADFCLTASLPVTDAITYFFPNGNARPGFPVSYTLYVFNAGTLPFSGNASLSYDLGKLDFVAASPAESNQVSNTLGFYINDLQPSQFKVYSISFIVKQPPVVNLGDVLLFDANMDTVDADAHVGDNTVVFNQVVVNSYDPNDITVQQGSQILQTQVADDLNYTIRFQNTGSAEAINVRLETELDDKLDWTTFRPVNANYNYKAERIGNLVTFHFD
ncbi:immunoglobulin domain-containing protein, partial [Flavobacterium sp. BFFFF1]|uniref:immunoglobulin domain-containing protein n=1 Tax=Flavobacterium sp. BFFFF1 TaxID=2015557 RepID=UPI0025C2E4F6